MVQGVLNVKRATALDDAKQKFWMGFAGVLQKRGVPEKMQEWHMRNVDGFIKHFRGLPLKRRTLGDVKVFLRHLKEVEGKESWHIDRVRQSIEMLYRDFLKMDLGASGLGKRLGPEELGEKWVEAVEKMRNELRFRHYSLRTEEVYVDWALRLAKFHDGREPTKIGDEGIKAFLSHLAIDLKVAASTQNQAA